MTALESHKQILIAESELNRELLLRDGQEMAAGLGSLAQAAKRWGSLAGVATLVAGGVSALWRKEPPAAPAKTSWFQKTLKGARLATSLWMFLRPASPDKSGHPGPRDQKQP